MAMSHVEIDTNSGGISSEASIARIDRIQVTFDDEHRVALRRVVVWCRP